MYVKAISGHTSLKDVQWYLEKEGRALARDSFQMPLVDEHGHSWSRQMDETRILYDNDSDWGSKKCRRYNHYIFSPDPRDNVSLEDLRNFMRVVAGEFFSSFQAVAVYHNDNTNHILHAHFVVNNTNLDTGKRLGPYVSKKKWREISNYIQDLAHDIGWHSFKLDLDLEETKEGELEVDLDKYFEYEREKEPQVKPYSKEDYLKYGVRSWKWNKDSRYTRGELEILAREGYSWKEEIRIKCRIARSLARTTDEYMRILTCLNVNVSKTNKGDFLYIHPKAETWKVSGNKLGRAFSYGAVDARFRREEAYRTDLEFLTMRKELLRQLRREGVVSLDRIGYATEDLDSRDVAKAIEVLQKHNVYSLKSLNNKISYSKDETKTEELAFARDMLNKLHVHDLDVLVTDDAGYTNFEDIYFDDLEVEGIRELANASYDKEAQSQFGNSTKRIISAYLKSEDRKAKRTEASASKQDATHTQEEVPPTHDKER